MATITYSGVSSAKVSIAELRESVMIQAMSQIEDGMGGYTEVWEEIGWAWAKIKSIRGKELLQAMQTEGQLTHRVIIRYRADIKENMRLIWEGSRTLEITSPPITLGNRQWMELMCREDRNA